MLFFIVNWIKSSNAVWFFTSKHPSQLDGDNAETAGFFFLFYITISALSYLVPFPSLWQEALGVILAEEKCCITHNSWLKGHVMNNYYIPSFLLNEVERIHSWIQWHLRWISRFLIYVTFWLDAVFIAYLCCYVVLGNFLIFLHATARVSTGSPAVHGCVVLLFCSFSCQGTTIILFIIFYPWDKCPG